MAGNRDRCGPRAYNRAEQAFSKGEPAWGAHLADELTRLINLHDASTIAAVIVIGLCAASYWFAVHSRQKGWLR